MDLSHLSPNMQLVIGAALAAISFLIAHFDLLKLRQKSGDGTSAGGGTAMAKSVKVGKHLISQDEDGKLIVQTPGAPKVTTIDPSAP